MWLRMERSLSRHSTSHSGCARWNCVQTSWQAVVVRMLLSLSMIADGNGKAAFRLSKNSWSLETSRRSSSLQATGSAITSPPETTPTQLALPCASGLRASATPLGCDHRLPAIAEPYITEGDGPTDRRARRGPTPFPRHPRCGTLTPASQGRSRRPPPLPGAIHDTQDGPAEGKPRGGDPRPDAPRRVPHHRGAAFVLPRHRRPRYRVHAAARPGDGALRGGRRPRLRPHRLRLGRRERGHRAHGVRPRLRLSLIHISEPTRLGMISYAVFCLKK